MYLCRFLTIGLTIGLFLAHFFGLWWSLDTHPAIYLALLMGTPFTWLLTGYVLFPEIKGKREGFPSGGKCTCKLGEKR